jgi:hypothetical protein
MSRGCTPNASSDARTAIQAIVFNVPIGTLNDQKHQQKHESLQESAYYQPFENNPPIIQVETSVDLVVGISKVSILIFWIDNVRQIEGIAFVQADLDAIDPSPASSISI